ncbi:MAG TPA: long-chain fatty acid--CoA ligase, partial [Propionibacteriaceae bacterium]|nr:long-chain fatty acid--CoA ligase [Propionibacteriaceae bacterium]
LLVKPSLPQLTDLADKLHINYSDHGELLNHPEIVDAVRERIQTLTAKLPSHEQIRDLRVLLEDFTMENGLLTPTLKVKRREVEKRFAQVIDDMYARIQERRKS